MAKSPEAFRTIGEVSEWLDTPPHVLRFWESRFPQLKPVKRAGGRRYYRPGDIALLGGIKQLLHDDGVTIRGVQKILQEKGIGHVAGLGSPASAAPDAPPQPLPPSRRHRLPRPIPRSSRKRRRRPRATGRRRPPRPRTKPMPTPGLRRFAGR
jgi:DNA-binding transcriptional MerR regulator